MCKPTNLKEYLELQMLEVLKHKWIKSQKKGKDVGAEAYDDWIKNHSKDFHKHFEDIFVSIINNVIKNNKKLLKEFNIADEKALDFLKILIESFCQEYIIGQIKPMKNPYPKDS